MVSYQTETQTIDTQITSGYHGIVADMTGLDNTFLSIIVPLPQAAFTDEKIFISQLLVSK